MRDVVDHRVVILILRACPLHVGLPSPHPYSSRVRFSSPLTAAPILSTPSPFRAILPYNFLFTTLLLNPPPVYPPPKPTAPCKIQQLTLAPLLAEAIRRIHEKTSISAIFKKGTVQPKNEKRITIDKGAARKVTVA